MSPKLHRTKPEKLDVPMLKRFTKISIQTDVFLIVFLQLKTQFKTYNSKEHGLTAEHHC